MADGSGDRDEYGFYESDTVVDPDEYDVPNPVEIDLPARPGYSPGGFPPLLDAFDHWGAGYLDESGGKRTHFPWSDGDPDGEDEFYDCRWSKPDNWGSRADAVAAVEHDGKLSGKEHVCPFFVLDSPEDPYGTVADPIVLVDFDDARCPVTGALHPFVREFIELAGSYGDVSFSDNGVHVYLVGRLPAGITAIAEDLEATDRFDDPEIEVYYRKRMCYATGKHLDGTPERIARDDGAIDYLVEYFDLEDDEKPAPKAPRSSSTYEFTYDEDEIEEMETGDMEAVRDAIARITPDDIKLKSDITARRSSGVIDIDPSWEHSNSGERLGYDPSAGPAGTWIYRAGDTKLNALDVVALEERVISTPGEAVTGKDFIDCLDELRRRGATVPQLEDDSGDSIDREITEDDAILDLGELTGTSTIDDLTLDDWDWERSGRDLGEFGDEDTTYQDVVRDRTYEAIKRAYDRGRGEVLVESIPSGGKSYNAARVAAEFAARGKQSTYLTGRGRKERYGEVKGWLVNDFGLEPDNVLILPRFHEACETARGDHGDGWKQRIMGWYNRRATPREIHAYAGSRYGDEPPCQEDGECEYTAKWNFDPDDYDVIIGHYTHAYVPNVVNGRATILDEFPKAYVHTTDNFEDGYWRAECNDWIERHGVPYDSLADLEANRDDAERRSETLAYIEPGAMNNENHLEPNPGEVIGENCHAMAGQWVYTLLAGEDHSEYVRSVDFPESRRVGVYNENVEEVEILNPPDLDGTYNPLVCLDGTPTREMWKAALGLRSLKHVEVLDADEKRKYVDRGLGMKAVLTTPYERPYNGQSVNPPLDEALCRTIEQRQGEKAAGISTKNAIEQWCEQWDEFEYDDETGMVHAGPLREIKWYGNLLGSNDYENERLGVVIGSNHYGDAFIKAWCAFLGRPFEVQRDETGTEYDGFAHKIATHMREDDTLQAVLRFGRDGDGSIVFVHTNTLPEWFPIAGEIRVSATWTPTMLAVTDAVTDILEIKDTVTVPEIMMYLDAEVSEPTVRGKLERLDDLEVLDVVVESSGSRAREYGGGVNIDADLVDLAESLEDVDVEGETAYAPSPGASGQFTVSDD